MYTLIASQWNELTDIRAANSNARIYSILINQTRELAVEQSEISVAVDVSRNPRALV